MLLPSQIQNSVNLLLSVPPCISTELMWTFRLSFPSSFLSSLPPLFHLSLLLPLPLFSPSLHFSLSFICFIFKRWHIHYSLWNLLIFLLKYINSSFSYYMLKHNVIYSTCNLFINICACFLFLIFPFSLSLFFFGGERRRAYYSSIAVNSLICICSYII